MNASQGSDRTIHAVLRLQARRWGDRAYLTFDGTDYSFAEIDRTSDRVAGGLQAAGVRSGDTVAVMMGNHPAFVFTWFALSKLGAVMVPLNTAHRGTILSHMLRTPRCRTIVADADLVPFVAEISAECPDLERAVTVGPGAGTTQVEGLRTIPYDALAGHEGPFVVADVSDADPLAVLFTSGTTGPSKGAVLPQSYALELAETISEVLGYGPTDRLYVVLPLFHGNALFMCLFTALVNGAQVVLRDRFSASEFWNDIRRFRCTTFNYMGSIIPILLKADPRPDDADHTLRAMFGAGAPANAVDAFEQRFGARLCEGYGMTEIGLPLVNSLSAPRRGASCGRVSRKYEVLLAGDDGVEVSDGSPGELLVRPRVRGSMMQGYCGMPEQTVAAWRDLWFHTGDYLRRDAEGYYFFVDRKKDALRRRGENISSHELEYTVNSHPAVLESAAVPARTELGEDDVMICVVPVPGAAIDPQELIEFCRTRMARFMVPRYVRVMQALPKTPTHRTEKHVLRAQGVTADTWDRGEDRPARQR